MKARHLRWVGSVACVGLSGLSVALVVAQKPVDFQREIRPILSDNCFSCHGPDESTRKANLRLDLHEGALAARRNGAPIVPGKPEQSLLYKKITEENPARRMPPLSTHKTLTDAQKETIKRWIEQGADGNSTGRSSRQCVRRCRP